MNGDRGTEKKKDINKKIQLKSGIRETWVQERVRFSEMNPQVLQKDKWGVRVEPLGNKGNLQRRWRKSRNTAAKKSGKRGLHNKKENCPVMKREGRSWGVKRAFIFLQGTVMASEPRESQACCNTSTREAEAGGCWELKISWDYIKNVVSKTKKFRKNKV